MNADGMVDTGQGLIGTNMFAYCENNPVMFLDSTGTAKEFIIDSDDIYYRYYSDRSKWVPGTTYYLGAGVSKSVQQRSGIPYYVSPKAPPPPPVKTTPGGNYHAPKGGNLKTNSGNTIKYIPPQDTQKFLTQQKHATLSKNSTNDKINAVAAKALEVIGTAIANPGLVLLGLAIDFNAIDLNTANDRAILQLESIVNSGHGVIYDEYWNNYVAWDNFDEGFGNYPNVRDIEGGGTFTWNE